MVYNKIVLQDIEAKQAAKISEKLFDKFAGALVEFYMISGKIFRGTFIKYENEFISLKGLDGKIICLKNEQVEAFTYIINDEKKELVKEKDPNDKIPQHEPGDIKTLVELKKMQADEEIQKIRNKLKSDKISTGQVEYGNSISTAIRAFKKHP